MSQSPVRHDRSAAVFDGVKQFDHVASLQLVYLFSANARADVHPENAFDRICATQVLADVALKECVQERIHRVGAGDLGFHGLALTGEIMPECELARLLLCQIARLVCGDVAMPAERNPMLLT